MHEKVILPNQEAERRVYYPRDPRSVAIFSKVKDALDPLIFLKRETKMLGLENLESLRSLHKDGKHIVLTPNHLSHLDHAFLYLLFHHFGFADLWEKTIFVGRKSLYKEPYFRPLLSVISMLGVYSTRELKSMNEREKETAGIHNRNVLRVAREKILKENKILIVYPEGGRSPTGSLIRADRAVASFWHLSESYVVPVGISGTEKVLPHSFLKKRILPNLLSPVTVSVGEPMEVSLLRQEAAFDKQKEVDLIMRRVASLLPEKYRGVYTQDKLSP